MSNGKYKLATVEGVYNDKWTLKPRSLRDYSPVGVKIDRRTAAKAFAAQLGQPLPSDLLELPDYIKGLAAAFILYGTGDREEAYKMLGVMSVSFDSDEDDDPDLDVITDCYVDIGDADDILTDESRLADVARATRFHDEFTVTWLVALLEFARKKGELAPSRFIWVRPVNRTIWYALNQLGSKLPHFEASGVWSHYESENVMEKSLSQPEIRRSVESLQYELAREGWLDESSDSKAGK